MTAPDPRSLDEDAIDDCEGCSSPEVADTGGALVGCLGWAALVFACFVAWVIYESVREAPPRHPPFSELPDSQTGGAK